MLPLCLFADAATGLLVGFPLVILVIAAFASIFWLWMLVDAITNPSLKDANKIIWVLVVLLLHFVGALLYFVMARGSRSGGV